MAPSTTPSSPPAALSRTFVCVACGADVPHLIRDYGKGNVRLAICGACNAVADPYVEFEHILLFLEIMLLRPPVYRHVLYNLRSPPQLRTLLKLFLILVMLDMNVKAYLIDRREGVTFRSESMYHQEQGQEISGLRISQYSLHLVCLALLENVVFALALFGMVWGDPFGRGWRGQLCRTKSSEAPPSWRTSPPRDALARFGTALCVSSFGKMFALLTVIWEFHWTFVHVIGGIVVCSNALGLQLLLGETSSAPWITSLVAVALACRSLTQVALYAVGNPTIFYVLA